MKIKPSEVRGKEEGSVEGGPNYREKKSLFPHTIFRFRKEMIFQSNNLIRELPFLVTILRRLSTASSIITDFVLVKVLFPRHLGIRPCLYNR